jgi:hypothetical protein
MILTTMQAFILVVMEWNCISCNITRSPDIHFTAIDSDLEDKAGSASPNITLSGQRCIITIFSDLIGAILLQLPMLPAFGERWKQSP